MLVYRDSCELAHEGERVLAGPRLSLRLGVTRRRIGRVRFVPFRHANPMVDLTTKHAVDERVLIEDLAVQVDLAMDIARAIGSGSRTAALAPPAGAELTRDR